MKLFDWLDGIEVTIVATLAAILLIIGPLFITYRFALSERYMAALLTGALWIACVAACVRDYRRQQLGWISGGFLLVWVLTTLVLGFVLT